MSAEAKNVLTGKIPTLPVVDKTLTRAGYSADAKATGEAIAENDKKIDVKHEELREELDIERKRIDESRGLIDQIANNQIPEEYLEAAVDRYVEGNSAGFATQASLEAVETDLKSDLIKLSDNNQNGYTKLQSTDFVQGGHANYKLNADKVRIRTEPMFLHKGAKINIVPNGLYFTWYLFETADGSTDALQSSSDWDNIGSSATLEVDGYFCVILANGKTYDTSTAITPSDYTSDITIYSGYANMWVNNHEEEVDNFMETLSKHYNHTKFKTYTISKGLLAKDKLRIHSIVSKKCSRGTKFTAVKPNGHYFLLEVYANPIDLKTQQTPIESSPWIGGETQSGYVLKNDGYVVILGANGYTYDASTNINPSDYLCEIEQTQPRVTKIDEMVTSDEIKQKTFASSFNEIGSVEEHVKNFCKLYKTMGRGDGFLFFTDLHVIYKDGWENRLIETMAYIEQIANTTPISFVLNGGDWLGAYDTQDRALYMLSRISGTMRSKFGNNFALLVGNHDTNYQGSLSEEDSENQIKNEDARLSQNAIDNTYSALRRKSFFSYEAPTFNMYCFDTGIESSGLKTDYYKNQVSWFANSLLTDESAYKAIAMHIVYDVNTLGDMANELTKCAKAFNTRGTYTYNGLSYDFSNCKGKVSFVIGGHNHADANGTINDIPYVLSTNASNYGSYSTLPIDLCAIDWENGKLYMYRCEIDADGSTREIDIII